VGGEPMARPSAPAAQIVAGTIAPNAGNVNQWSPKQYVRWETGRVLELSMEVSAPAGNGDTRARFAIARFDGSYTSLSAISYVGTGVVTAGASSTITLKIGLGVNVAGG